MRLRLPYAPANGQLRFRSLYFVGARMIVTWAPTQCEGRGIVDNNLNLKYLIGVQSDLSFTGRLLFLWQSEPKKPLKAGPKVSNTSKNGLLGSMEI